jgi:hypothetical protein
MPEVLAKPLPEPIETVRRVIEYIPEVKVGRAIIDWIRSQPPADPAPPPRQPQSTQAR